MISILLYPTGPSRVPTYHMGFFCNLFDANRTEGLFIQDKYPRNTFLWHDMPFVDGVVYESLLSGILPLTIPAHARPNVLNGFTPASLSSLPTQTFLAKYFAEPEPVTYPMYELLDEQDGIMYYSTAIPVEMFAPGTEYAHDYTIEDVVFNIAAGSAAFTGYGTQPPELGMANYGFRVDFKVPEMEEPLPPPAPQNYVVASFFTPGNDPDHTSNNINFSNPQGLWKTEAEFRPYGFIIINTYKYGSNTMSNRKGYAPGTLTPKNALRLIKKPAYSGQALSIGIGISSTHAEREQRLLIKDRATNVVLEDQLVPVWADATSSILSVEVLDGTALPGVTLEHTPVYYPFTNAEDTAFETNTWDGRIMHANEASITITNETGIGFIGDF